MRRAKRNRKLFVVPASAGIPSFRLKAVQQTALAFAANLFSVSHFDVLASRLGLASPTAAGRLGT